MLAADSMSQTVWGERLLDVYETDASMIDFLANVSQEL